MKSSFSEKISIPEGVSCTFENKVLKCTKGSSVVEKKIDLPSVDLKIENSEINFICKSANRNEIKYIRSSFAHLKNIFSGLGEKFVYELEAVNVHFPMTLKVEGSKLLVNNFLGEKVPRSAFILPNVDVSLKGNHIVVSSHDKEAAGQTAANFEKATKLTGRDRRVFQDGIYIVKFGGSK